jgi:hypothetical protein
MTNNDKDDKALNDYLEGNSGLSNRYHASSSVEPPADLDAKILLAAKEAVGDAKQKPKVVFHKSPWAIPVSIAAVITLSVSLIITMQQETGQPLINESEFYDSTVFVEEAEVSQTLSNSDGIPVMNKAERKQSKDERLESAAPAKLNSVESYRTENKPTVPKAKIREHAAKKTLMKENAPAAILEERIFADEQILQSAPAEVELDDMMDFKRDRQHGMEESKLLKIKALWEAGEFDKAKQTYEDFVNKFPEFAAENIKKILGADVYYGLIDF